MDDLPRTLNILQVSAGSRGGGGAEDSAWNLFHRLRTLGHNSWLAVGSRRTNDPNVFLISRYSHRKRWARLWYATDSLLDRLGGRIRGAGRLRKLVHWISEPRSLLEYVRGHEDFNFPGTWNLLDLTPEKPDIIQCHTLHSDYFDLRALPWLSHQVPVILNLRDAWLLSGHCAHSLGCERWKIGCGQCPDLSIFPAVLRDATDYNWQRKRSIFERSRLYITTPSQWLMDKVQASMLRGILYRVIPNAIDRGAFKPGDQSEARKYLGLPNSSRIILLIAHNMFKDYEAMESALSQLDKIDNSELIFVCLGKNGVDKALGSGRMVYRGFERNQERMVLYYRASDVFIHAAKDESWGKTVTEAMACGLPVVATAVGGITEQIKNGKTGFLVPPGDRRALSTAVHSLLTDSALRSSMRKAGVELVSRCFGLEIQANAFLNWYHEILMDWRKHQSSISKSD